MREPTPNLWNKLNLVGGSKFHTVSFTSSNTICPALTPSSSVLSAVYKGVIKQWSISLILVPGKAAIMHRYLAIPLS